MESLFRNGSTAFAFDFRKPFDAEGKATVLDRAAVKAKAAVHAGSQGRDLGFVAADRKAIQPVQLRSGLRPAGFGRAEGFSRRGGSGILG
jgi:hypothetical protein